MQYKSTNEIAVEVKFSREGFTVNGKTTGQRMSADENEVWNTVTANNKTSRGSTPFSVAIDEIGMFPADDAKQT